MSYVTTTQLKAYLGIDSSLESDDEILQVFIDSATEFIDETVGFTFKAKADTTRTFTWGIHTPGNSVTNSHDNRFARNVLTFDTWLAQPPTTVVNGDGTTVASSEYVMLESNFAPHYALQLKRHSSTCWTYDESPEDSISVTGRWGYSLTPPSDIVQASLRLASYFYRQKDSQVFDSTAFTELGPIQMKSQIPSDVTSALTRYVWVTR